MEQAHIGQSAPDFRHVRNWIFDLDNTLYRADCGLFARIDQRMTDYIAEHLSLQRDIARQLQKELYRTHGTTLNGLVKLHGIDPETYLDYVHDIDLSDLMADRHLRGAVAALPGRRFIFTNGCRRHAGRILERLDLTDLFEDVWDIRTMGFVPKPDPNAYALVVKAAGIRPAEAAMFDDLARNLVAARELGMTTVWLNTPSDFACHGPDFPVASAAMVDHETADLAAFLHSLRTSS